MKDNVRQFAMFGGTAAFPADLLVGRPNVGDREAFLHRLGGVLDSGWFTHYGPRVRELEQRVAERVDTAHCVLVSNATTGLELVLRAAGLTGEVIMPAMTFVATAHSARYHGVRPVFCDVDPVTGVLDPNEVERLITPRTSAILGVHLWGQPCVPEQLAKIADANGIKLYFDAAHAFGATANGRSVGTFGMAEVFSLHATKVVNSFEGGAIVTDDGDLAARLRQLLYFGVGADGVVREAGTNAKLTEAAACMGLTSLEALDDSIRSNEANHHRYREGLEGVPGVEVLTFDSLDRNNFQYMVIKVDESVTGLRRDALLALLRAERVRAQRYFSPCCHQLEPYRTERPVVLANTEALSAKVMSLPTGSSVSADDVAGVCGLIRTAAEHGEEITARWLAGA